VRRARGGYLVAGESDDGEAGGDAALCAGTKKVKEMGGAALRLDLRTARVVGRQEVERLSGPPRVRRPPRQQTHQHRNGARAQNQSLRRNGKPRQRYILVEYMNPYTTGRSVNKLM
jgi:hypothetical protein